MARCAEWRAAWPSASGHWPLKVLRSPAQEDLHSDGRHIVDDLSAAMCGAYVERIFVSRRQRRGPLEATGFDVRRVKERRSSTRPGDRILADHIEADATALGVLPSRLSALSSLVYSLDSAGLY